ncbi:histidinol-phosphate transaminase [Pectobacteriaceae bacterium CE70]|nr:histidinol-phosphate transaminase [Pectobacteriaceae bacterium CE70]WJY09967.1 histidinol-phosphate transaminase [Pectobacteriaceae bacterium C80]
MRFNLETIMSEQLINTLVRKEARQLGAYNAGLSDEAVRAHYNVDTIARLASNENPLGASPQVITALQESARLSAIYPDPSSQQLRDALAQTNGVDANRVIIGNGSEDLLKLLCLAFVNPGDRVVTLLPSFGLHLIYPQMMGANVTGVPVNAQMAFDVAAWQQALQTPAKMVMFSNPSNPVGCMLDGDGFQRLIDSSPQDCLLVIDEAYYEYCTQLDGYPDSLAVLQHQARPWIVLRTFSKAYGLAGLRVGYGLASDPALVDILNRVRTPFNINRAAQAAAIVALHDNDHTARSVAHVNAQRTWLADQLTQLQLQVVPSSANFLFFRTARDSAALAQRLLPFGVIVKPWLEPGYTHWIRVSVGSAADNQRFISALRQVL